MRILCEKLMGDTIMISYEQPLTEVMRACLRLEQLFQQIDYQLQDASLWGTRRIMVLMNDLLQLLDRADLKTKLAKEMNYQLYYLMQHQTEDTMGCMLTDSHSRINQLQELVRYFIDTNGKIGQSLRELELFTVLRLHLMTPSGDCSFDMPMYHYWLKQPSHQRKEMIQTWMMEFIPIRTAVVLMLQFIRQHIKTETKKAINGFYQELLNPQQRLCIVRINLPYTVPAYPEVSIGRRFLGICFLSPDIKKKAIQYEENFEFLLDYHFT